MSELRNHFGQVLTIGPSTRIVAFIPKGAKVVLQGNRAWFFHKDYPVSECTIAEIKVNEPRTLEAWLKILRPVVLS